MLFKYSALVLLSTISLGESQLNCENKDIAGDKFEYYTPWYRFRHGIIFWTTRKICALTEEESKFVCAQVAKACFPALAQVPVEEIEKEIKTTPGHCKKEEYTTPKKGGDFKGGLKKMFPCPKYTALGQLVTSFFVSYGGSAGTALIFERESSKNLNIDEELPIEKGTKSFIQLAHYVTGLKLEKPQDDNNQNKSDQKQTQNKHDPNVNPHGKSDQKTDAQIKSDQNTNSQIKAD